MDIMLVNGLYCLTAISKQIHYRTAQYLKDKTSGEHTKALMEVIQMYKQGGYQVTHIFCENEFQPLLKNFVQQGVNIEVNFSSLIVAVPLEWVF
jgi:hypothetical protein